MYFVLWQPAASEDWSVLLIWCQMMCENLIIRSAKRSGGVVHNLIPISLNSFDDLWLGFWNVLSEDINKCGIHQWSQQPECDCGFFCLQTELARWQPHGAREDVSSHHTEGASSQHVSRWSALSMHFIFYFFLRPCFYLHPCDGCHQWIAVSWI